MIKYECLLWLMCQTLMPLVHGDSTIQRPSYNTQQHTHLNTVVQTDEWAAFRGIITLHHTWHY